MRFASILAAFFLFTVAFLLGADVLDNEFALDARLIVQGRDALTSSSLGDLVAESWWPTPEAGRRLHRPATLVFFSWVAAIADGTSDPEPFNRAVLLLHALNAMARFLLVAQLLKGRRGRDLFAFLAALLPTLHAISYESVVGIVGAAELLAGLFMTLAWYVFALGWERRGPMGGGLFLLLTPVLWFLALLSKETALLFPLVPIFHALILRPTEKARSAAVIFAILLAIGAGAGFAALRVQALGDFGLDSETAVHAEFTTPQRVASSLAVLGDCYLPELFRPDELQPNISFQDVPPPEGFGDRRVIFGLIFLLVLGLWLLAATIHMRPEAMLLLFALVTYLPTSNLIVPIDAVGAWRFLYSPLFGLAAALALALEREYRLRGRLRLLLTAVCGVVLVFGALGTARLVDDWQDEPTLYARALEIEPHSVWALQNLAASRDLSGRGPTDLNRLIETLERYDGLEPHLATLPGSDRFDRTTRIVAARMLMDRAAALGTRAPTRRTAERAANDAHDGVRAALRAEAMLWEDRGFAFDARLRAFRLRMMELGYLQQLDRRDASTEQFTLQEAGTDIAALDGLVREGVDPDRELRFLLEAANHALQTSDNRRAQGFLERAAKIDPAHPEVALSRARLEIEYGRPNDALAMLEPCFAAERAHIAQHALAAGILEKLGNRKEAFLHLLHVAGMEPRNAAEKQLKDQAIVEINASPR